MSTLFLFVGQCGNQVGSELIEKLFTESLCDNPRKQASLLKKQFHNENPFEDSELIANAILIDTEPKVVNSVIDNKKNQKNKSQKQDPRFSKFEQVGAGNNWALGYDYGKKFESFIDQKLTQMIDKVEFANGNIVSDIVIAMSAAGGTGSGLGSQIVEYIWKNQGLTLMCILIWPHRSGEVVLQSTNSVFTMTYLYQNSNAILNVENDHIQETVRHTLGISKPSIEDQNRLIAKMIAHCFLVTSPSEIIADLTTPELKLLNLRYAPIHSDSSTSFQNLIFKQLVNRVVQMCITNTNDQKIIWNVKPINSKFKMQASKLIVTEEQSKSIDKSEITNAINESFIGHDKLQCRKLNSPNSTNYQNIKQDGNSKAVSILYNGNQIIDTLESSLIQSYDKFYQDAFMHHQQRYNLDKTFIENRIYIQEGIIKKYKNI